jgi:hypothetical protein
LGALHFLKQSLYLSAGYISQLRSAWLYNDTFGIFAAKHQFHAYIQSLPRNLVKQLDNFLEFAERENFAFAVSFKSLNFFLYDNSFFFCSFYSRLKGILRQMTRSSQLKLQFPLF